MPTKIDVRPIFIQGPLLIQPSVFEDDRGFFFESYSLKTFSQHGLEIAFVQDNHSRSSKGVLRGFHFQDMRAPQWRLVRCTVGTIWDVIVDLRVSSPTFGHWFGIELTAAGKEQLLIPPEFAHGFCVLSEAAEVQYKCSHCHTPDAERTLAWDDPEIAVSWPPETPILSQRDSSTGSSLQTFRELALFP